MRNLQVLAVVLVAAVLLGGRGAEARDPAGTEVFRFADPAIIESSGLVARDGLFMTVNDSGDTGRVFVVDPTDGTTVGVTRWSDDPVDVEALAPAGRGAVWVGDIGDNAGERSSVRVARVPVGRGDREVTPPTYDLVYPDGARDAETLLVDPQGRLVVVTKGLFGGEVLRAPRSLEAGAAQQMTRIGEALGIATDGAFFPDGQHLILRNYGAAAIYTYPGLDEVGRFDLPDQPQGEGIAVDERGDVFLSTEGKGAAVLQVLVPARILRAMTPTPTPTPEPTSTPVPVPEPTEPVEEEPTATATEVPGEVSDEVPGEVSLWPWLLGGLVGLAVLAGLVRSLRPRG